MNQDPCGSRTVTRTTTFPKHTTGQSRNKSLAERLAPLRRCRQTRPRPQRYEGQSGKQVTCLRMENSGESGRVKVRVEELRESLGKFWKRN